MPELNTVIFFAGLSLLSAAAGILMTGRMLDRLRPTRSAGAMIFADAPRRYEFREGYLLSPVDPDDVFLPHHSDRSSAFDALAQSLSGLNPDLPTRFSALDRRGEAFVLTGALGQDILSVAGRAEDDRLIVTIGPTETGKGRQVVDIATLDALGAEAEDLRGALDAGGTVIWKQDGVGRVLWANAPYFALADRLSPALADDTPRAATWPAPALFADHLDPMPDGETPRRCRLSLPPGDEALGTHADGALWFDVSARPHGDGNILCTAAPVDRLVAAETSLRNFVQTLSKTFAHLPIGLAIFDRRRELMLFNPALLTLSTLGSDFLSNRPTLVAFLDALRDRQRMPEPKNYRHWRDEIARLEQDASDGTYQEMWTLPTGQSFRVIGRPHPDGALAFMFEDITSEMSLTRKFRGDLELHQSVLDSLPDAIAVFSGEGRMVLANDGYATLWGGAAPAAPGAQSLADATRIWQAHSLPTDIWRDIGQFAARTVERTSWSAQLTLRDGRRMTLRVAPLTGGAMSVRFVSGAAAAPGQMQRPAPLVAAVQGVHGMAEPRAEFRSRQGLED
jgi:PAS domain-containing protein